MGSMIFTIGSVTQAARLAKRAQSNGIYNARMIHTPSELNKGGCSYSVELPEEDAEAVKRVAERYHINIKKIYRAAKTEGGVEYYDLSG